MGVLDFQRVRWWALIVTMVGGVLCGSQVAGAAPNQGATASTDLNSMTSTNVTIRAGANSNAAVSGSPDEIVMDSSGQAMHFEDQMMLNSRMVDLDLFAKMPKSRITKMREAFVSKESNSKAILLTFGSITTIWPTTSVLRSSMRS